MHFVYLVFNHRPELALKDGLKEFLEPVETALSHLYYLYTKSTKKYGELKIIKFVPG